MDEYLLLKWGTLKGWNVGDNKAAKAALQKYHDDPATLSVMMQRDTDRQKTALYELIDAINGEIQNDWSGEIMTKDEAKKYVREYGRDKVGA